MPTSSLIKLADPNEGRFSSAVCCKLQIPACRAMIPRDVGPVLHGKAGHRSTASRAG
jgi:hypothetical protein